MMERRKPHQEFDSLWVFKSTFRKRGELKDYQPFPQKSPQPERILEGRESDIFHDISRDRIVPEIGFG